MGTNLYTPRPGNTDYQLFVDGGVVQINPSPIGGTYAYRLVYHGQIIEEKSGFISPENAIVFAVSNNLTEMLALVSGLEILPDTWDGTIYSDSMITLGRVFLGWRWKNIPSWLSDRFSEQTKRLKNWETIGHTLLSGHPTKYQLAQGFGKHGLPVSKHNAWCDQACQNEAQKAKKRLVLFNPNAEVALGK